MLRNQKTASIQCKGLAFVLARSELHAVHNQKTATIRCRCECCRPSLVAFTSTWKIWVLPVLTSCGRSGAFLCCVLVSLCLQQHAHNLLMASLSLPVMEKQQENEQLNEKLEFMVQGLYNLPLVGRERRNGKENGGYCITYFGYEKLYSSYSRDPFLPLPANT